MDHDLACALWETGNHDARTLAVKIADPLRMSPADLDRWVRDDSARMCTNYVAALACEGPHGLARVKVWLAAKVATLRAAGWSLVGALAMQDETLPDAWFSERLTEIEAAIHSAPNTERAAMNAALIAIGCRNAATRKSAGAAAKRIGKVEIDHGDTDCKTPDAASYIEKSWTHSTAKGFASPAAQERSREPIRLRC